MTDEEPLLWPLDEPEQLTDPAAPVSAHAASAQKPIAAADEPSTQFLETGQHDASSPSAAKSLSSAAPAAPLGQPSAAPRDRVACPECGTVQFIHLNRREALDFCRNCDFPLFWTPSEIVRDRGSRAGEGLRRLPGTVGRSTLASMACPNCAELNLVAAEVCIRCGKPMHPVVEAPPPPPEPVYVPPPPAIEPSKPRGVPWWVWAAAIAGGLAVLVFVMLVLTGVIF
jgi:hypothetical protein